MTKRDKERTIQELESDLEAWRVLHHHAERGAIMTRRSNKYRCVRRMNRAKLRMAFIERQIEWINKTYES